MSNTIKFAVDFVSPFNSTEMQENIDRIYREKKREDYMGVNRSLHKGLTRALQVLQSAAPTQKRLTETEAKCQKVTIGWVGYLFKRGIM